MTRKEWACEREVCSARFRHNGIGVLEQGGGIRQRGEQSEEDEMVTGWPRCEGE